MRNRRTTLAIYVAVFVLLVDQMTKWFALRSLHAEEGGMTNVTPYLNFVLVWNKGVTFGFLNHMAKEYMPWVLIGTAALILILLGRWLLRTTSTLVAISLGAIMGGAVGNVVDRLHYGAVVDFLDFYYAGHHYPWAFNVADAAIVTGVILLVLESLVRGR